MSHDGDAEIGFTPLEDDRAMIERILVRLNESTDLTERAELAGELVRGASRYEDIVEQAFEPALRRYLPPQEIERIDEARDALRDVLTVVHERTTHVDPRNVHQGDAQGFEDALGLSIERLLVMLALDDDAIGRLWRETPAEERSELEAAAGHASRHASEQPRPPRTAVGRLVSNAKVKMDHSMRDVSKRPTKARSTLEP
jgi:hypothetical protein